MNTQGLIRGAWLLNTKTETPFQVRRIEEKQVLPEDDRWYIDIADCEPIPITRDFLIKNGWTHVPNSDKFLGNNLYMYIKGNSDDTSFEIFGGISIRYVHELQMALCLIGSDVELRV